MATILNAYNLTGGKINAEVGTKVLTIQIETLAPDAPIVLFIEGSFKTNK